MPKLEPIVQISSKALAFTIFILYFKKRIGWQRKEEREKRKSGYIEGTKNFLSDFASILKFHWHYLSARKQSKQEVRRNFHCFLNLGIKLLDWTWIILKVNQCAKSGMVLCKSWLPGCQDWYQKLKGRASIEREKGAQKLDLWLLRKKASKMIESLECDQNNYMMQWKVSFIWGVLEVFSKYAPKGFRKQIIAIYRWLYMYFVYISHKRWSSRYHLLQVYSNFPPNIHSIYENKDFWSFDQINLL